MGGAREKGIAKFLPYHLLMRKGDTGKKFQAWGSESFAGKDPRLKRSISADRRFGYFGASK